MVLAVIAILAALLLPALAGAKKKALSIVCFSNVRQLTVCWLMYADENRGFIVPNRSIDTGLQYKISAPGSWIVGDAQRDISEDNIRKGLLFTYNKSVAIYRCPSDKTKHPVDGREIRRRFNYGLSCFMNGGSPDRHVSEEPLHNAADRIVLAGSSLFGAFAHLGARREQFSQRPVNPHSVFP